MSKAKAAARAVGGFVAAPDFGVNRPEGATDFNDLAPGVRISPGQLRTIQPWR
jgi:phage/plasmid primase-like uncharacterized protein